jgi:hypothetical protein
VPGPTPAYAEQAGASEVFSVYTGLVALRDAGAAEDLAGWITQTTQPPDAGLGDTAAASEGLSASISLSVALADAAGAGELPAAVSSAAVPWQLTATAGTTTSITVSSAALAFSAPQAGQQFQLYSGGLPVLPPAVRTITGIAGTVISFAPAAASAVTAGMQALEYIPGRAAYVAPASPAFIRSAMPRMHLQNLLTGAWLHRDVQGITSPVITWTLNAAGTFTCTLAPPRADLLDSTGNPVINEWQTACYLEESDEIKFGGICTSSTGQGPSWTPTFTEFAGYASGTIYEGPVVTAYNYEALAAVRALWAWVQAQPYGNLGLVVGAGVTTTLLGAYELGGASTVLTRQANPGDTRITVASSSGISQPGWITIGSETHYVAKAPVMSATVVPLSSVIQAAWPSGTVVIQEQAATPYQLAWWNGTDCGQEIASIQAEAVFDSYERHTWNPDRSGVIHQLLFGVPRIGARRSDLRFAEGENIVTAAQITRDGTKFANNVIGQGAGQGSAMVRQTASVPNGRLRRTIIYQNQTVTVPARMQAMATRVLAAVQNIDTPVSVTVINHPNAPFGSFICGDDIYVQLASGWRSAGIWCRITAMTQDPTTSLMTLTLARSDSFTYLVETGQAGTV